MERRATTILLAAGLALLCACDSDDGSAGGEGTLRVTIWGEAYIEDGIPAADFADGWEVTFDTFLVSVGELAATAQGESAPAFTDAQYRVFDLVTTDGEALVTTATIPAGTYGHFDYVIGPSGDSVIGNATAADVALMQDEGLAVYVEGHATDGTTTIQFVWGFADATAYHGCESTAVVEPSGGATTQMTIHGDHLFYDDLADPEARLRFQTFADADDGDGDLTQEELAAVAGVTFQALDNYGVGDAAVDDLRAYVTYLVGTLGHIDGEGHCGE